MNSRRTLSDLMIEFQEENVNDLHELLRKVYPESKFIENCEKDEEEIYE
jgi:hypothetical protein